jgi:hypothetical protein
MRYALALAFPLLGCGNQPRLVVDSGAKDAANSRAASTAEPKAADDHTHERGKMQIADAGPYHALLTAHLSKDGHELDIFFETASKDAKPVALNLAALKASVQIREGAGALQDAEFVPAPASERPAGEARGTCSHFVAKTPWLKPDAVHRVVIRALIDGKDEEIRWNEFVPRKFAHHAD